MTIYYSQGRYTFGSGRPLSRRQLDQLLEGLEAPDFTAGRTLSGRRSVTRLRLDDVGSVIVKHFLRGGLPAHLNRRTYCRLGKTRGQREFEQMVRVRQLGVQTPEPIAFAFKGRFFYATWLVTREIEPVQSMAQLSLSAPGRAKGALEELSRQVAILIDHRILHPDLHPGNVLVDDRDRVYIIDLDKTGTYRWGKTSLGSKYRRRWRRAIHKHGLAPMLYEFQVSGR